MIIEVYLLTYNMRRITDKYFRLHLKTNFDRLVYLDIVART